MLTCKSLNFDGLKKIFYEHLIIDFPKNEIIPLKILQKIMKKGLFFCYGFYDDNELVGYAAVTQDKATSSALLEYFAVVADKRNQGYGTAMLNMLLNMAECYKYLVIEVDDPDFAANEKETKKCNRRIYFYKNCGVKATRVNTLTFGAHFNIMIYSKNNMPTDSEIIKSYKNFYLQKVSHLIFFLRVKIHCQ